MLEAGCDHRLVVGDDLCLQRRKDPRERLAAEASVAFGQARVGDGFGAGFVYPGVFAQPGNESRFAFLRHQLPDDFVLQVRREAAPRGSEQRLLRQGG